MCTEKTVHIVVSAVSALLLAGAALAGDAGNPGVPLIEKSIRIEDQGAGLRYQSPKSFPDTLKFYRKLWSQRTDIAFHGIPGPPGVNAELVENSSAASRWDWMHIYEKDGAARIFIHLRTTPQER